MSSPPDFADRMYRLILHVYPPEYVETFGDEMYNTFIDGANDAMSQGILGRFILRELRDTPKVLANAYWNGWKKKLQDGLQTLHEVTTTSDLPPASPDGRESWAQVLFEGSPFLITGLLLILSTYLSLDGWNADWQRDFGFLGKIIIPLALPLFLIGLARGLPRWAYPFGGLLFGYFGLASIQSSLWLFLSILFFSSLVLALAAIVTDPQPSLLPTPLRRIRQSLSMDWTRLSFAFYGAMPMVILMAFDDSHYNDRTPYLAFSVLAMIAGALFYCRSRDKIMQMTALLFGVTFSIIGALLDKVFFADGLHNWIVVSSQGVAGSLWIFKLWVQWMLFVLSPACLVLFGRAVHVRRAI